MTLNKKTAILLLTVTILLCAILIWYCLPYEFRKIYYNKFDSGVRDTIINDSNFLFNIKGFSKTYDYKNQYLMPARVSIKLTKINDLLPKDPTRGPLVKANIKVLLEILHDGKIIGEFINEVPFTISYVIRRGERFRRLQLFSDIPTSYLAKFHDDVKLRITVLENDPVLEGCEGILIVEPQTRW